MLKLEVLLNQTALINKLVVNSDAKHVEFKKTVEKLYSKVDMLSNVIMLPNTSTIM